jgi:glycosyltransferase involved in cell wall biosynthesis
MKRVTVLIPCYNEADSIAKVIKRFPRQRLARAGFELSIIVIDNNSNDETAKQAAAAGAKVLYEARQGKGYALRTGFQAIDEQCDYVVMLDGDDTYRPEEIMRLLEPLESGFAQIIIGSRLQGQMRSGSMKRFNRLGNWGYTYLVRLIYRLMVTDVLTGYFAWTREAIEDLRPHITSSGFAIEMEMITKMGRLGYQIYSVPITYDPRSGTSSLNPIRDGLRILLMFIRSLRWRPATAESEALPRRGFRKLRPVDWSFSLIFKNKGQDA